MKAFAELLDRLVLTPSRNGKLTLLVDYFRQTPDPDRGYALAALAGTLDIGTVKPALLRELVLERLDEVLFRYSYDYVGDLAETIALVWGGTLGNLYDRASLGAVRDWVKWYVVWGGRPYVWRNFNIADSSICVGVCLWLLLELRLGSRKRQAEPAPPGGRKARPARPR